MATAGGDIDGLMAVSRGPVVLLLSRPAAEWGGRQGEMERMAGSLRVEGENAPGLTVVVRAGRVYNFGGTGIPHALDGRNGAVRWSRDVAKDSGAQTPGWGFAASPPLVDGTAAGGQVGGVRHRKGRAALVRPGGRTGIRFATCIDHRSGAAHRGDERPGGDLPLSEGEGNSLHRVAMSQGAGGFDGSILSCIDLLVST